MDFLPQRIRDKIQLDHSALERNPKLKGPCWVWQGGDSGTGRGGGYGKVWWEGKMRYFHVIVWILSGRRKPAKNLQLDHECCVRRCGNPDHLKLRTQSLNCRLGWKRRKDRMEIACASVEETDGPAGIPTGLGRSDQGCISLYP